MAAEARVEPISAQQLDALLPLIAAYQRFYEVEDVDDERNRAFFSRFVAPSCCAEIARERGAHHLEWATAPGNIKAQRLYDATGAERSEWIEYELELGRSTR